MPTYSYRCTECETAFDTYQAFTDASLTDCPTCAGRLRKVFSSIGVTFNGSGFYRNDSRAPGKGQGTGPGKGTADATSPAGGSGSGSSAAGSSAKVGAAASSSSSGSGSSSSSSAKTSSTASTAS